MCLMTRKRTKALKLIFVFGVLTIGFVVFSKYGGVRGFIDKDRRRTTIAQENVMSRKSLAIKTRATSHHHDDSLALANDSQVLIVGYHRSGSTLMGAFLSQVENSFYVYEPLQSMFVSSRNARLPVQYLNRSLPNGYPTVCHVIFSSPIAEGYELPIVKKTLESIFNCDLGYLHLKNPITAYHNCTRQCYSRVVCLQRINDLCRSKNTKVVKTIRISMITAQYFLDKYPNLKVIHLIRDPRGMICSLGCSISRKEWKKRCAAVYYDVTTRMKLTHLYPGRTMEVVYEDFAHYPNQIAAKILNFIQKPYTHAIKTWIRDHMFAGNDFDGKHMVTRPNSTEAAYAWVKKLKRQFIRLSNQNCVPLLRHGGFVNVTSEHDLYNFIVPYRPRPKYYRTDPKRG